MPEQALYLKWRPLSFDDVVGQDHITRTLRNSLKTGRIRHAYLFSGPRGTGKTTMARLLTKAVNCQNEDTDKRPCNACPSCMAMNENRFLDLIEIDAATHTGVDDVRELRDKIAFSPGEGRYKVYIIDEVHRFTGNAFDALLKTLEEPPDHAIFVLATTEIDKVPATIKSRCLQFEFRRISLMQVADRLEEIAKAEGLTIERGALEVIARQGTGSARDSISLLDQIVSDPEEAITLEIVQRVLGTANSGHVRDLVDAIIAEDVPRGLHIINHAVDTGSDPRQFGQQIVEHLRAIMLAQTASADLVEASTEDRELFSQQASAMPRSRILKSIRTFNEAVNDNRGGWQPQLPLELALIESLREDEPQVIQQIVQQAPAFQAGGGKPAKQTVNPLLEMPEAEVFPPGAPPVVAPSVLQKKWTEMLKALYRYSTSAPDVVQHFRVQRIDGSSIYLATDNQLYFRRLDGQPEKLHVIEKAIYDIHNVATKVHVRLVEDISNLSANAESVGEVDDPLVEEGLSLGAQLGSEESLPPGARQQKEDDAQ